jgi:hypothetical protein
MLAFWACILFFSQWLGSFPFEIPVHLSTQTKPNVSGSVDLNNYDFLTRSTDPAVRAIEYIRTTTDIDSHNAFKGDPSMEVDHA